MCDFESQTPLSRDVTAPSHCIDSVMVLETQDVTSHHGTSSPHRLCSLCLAKRQMT